MNERNIKHFENFYSLLWYYYTYDKEKYRKIWQEYEKRFSGLILEKVGFNEKMIKELYDDQEKTNNNILDTMSPIAARKFKSSTIRAS